MSGPLLTFERHPSSYRHWQLRVDGDVATVTLAVDSEGGLRDDYSLKSNSYDLGVDIELADLVQRLRFEHPEVRAVVLTGGLDKTFCAGANIQMLAGSTHHHKVNFCKFTNETRAAIEDASASSGQVWIAALNGTAAGGGYEMALACDEIVLIDDRASTVSLPEVPLLGVLPGTGGLTRVTDKRHVRRDRADLFATRPDGVQGQQALEWRLVDHLAPRSRFEQTVAARAAARAAESDRPEGAAGVVLGPLDRAVTTDGVAYEHVEVTVDRDVGAATITVRGPAAGAVPGDLDALVAAGDRSWPVAAARQLDDAVLHLRFNEPELGTWVLRAEGDAGGVLAADDLLSRNAEQWLVREIRLYWRRVLSRLDLSARTLVAAIGPGSCFVGTLAELALAADRSFMLDGSMEGDDRPPPALVISDVNLAGYEMANGLTRLATRFWADDAGLAAAAAAAGKELLAAEAEELGLVTFAYDDLDWEDELRLFLEERDSFSPDALTGLEANLRFAGPETMATKIFGRLTAWQNWIFQRPNAAGPDGALRRYGTGSRPTYDRTRN